MQASGKCLCGTVAISFEVAERSFDACHCGMCCRWSGGPALMVHAGAKVSLTGDDHITVFESSRWAERAFCRRCGTHLFYRLKHSGKINVPLGLLEDTDDFRFQSQIFVDRRHKGYEFANQTPTMTEAEVFAKYAPKS